MSDPDLERRLERLEPARPRPELRDDVLRAVAAARPGRLRRFAWSAAAAVVVALIGLNAWVEAAHEARLVRLVGDSPQTLRARRASAVERQLMALVDRPEKDAALRWRVRLRLTARRVPKTPAFTVVGGPGNG